MKSYKHNIVLLSLLLNITALCSAASMTVMSPDGEIDDSDLLCSLSEAIINANDDAMTYSNCAAGDGADTIVLMTDVILNEAYENDSNFGLTGLPPIESEIILNGQGLSLKRNESLSCDVNENNEASEFRLLRNVGDLTLINIDLKNGCADGFSNSARGLGGAIFNSNNLSISNIIFSENTALSGGAIYNSNNNLEINNSTFNNNKATNQGGAILNRAFISLIENTTFSNNTASFTGGAITNSLNATINIINNVSFVNNNSTSGSTGAISTDLSSQIMNLTNSLFSNNGKDCSLTQTITGSNNITDDVLNPCPDTSTTLTTSTVGPLADNGGATMTHALLVGSEALDASMDGSGNDQRGFAADGARDIGAFEAQIPVVTAPADITTASTGDTTPVDLGMASVTDADEMGLTASPSDSGPFADGTHEITWTATDSEGHVGTDTQTVIINSVAGYDVAISNPTVPEYTIVPNSIGYISDSLGFTIQNNGSNTISGFFLNRQYVVDGEIIQDFDSFIDMELQPNSSSFVDTGAIGIGISLLGVITVNYSVTLDGEEDENPSDNTINDIFLLISDTKEMARDDQIATIATELTDPNGTQIGQLFSINNESTLESVVFVFSNKTCDANTGACSLDGLDISAKIYIADLVTGRPIMEVISTESYNVPNGEDFEIIQNLPIVGGPIVLPPANYVAVIDTPADPDPNDILLPSLGLYFTDNRFTEGTTWYDIGGNQNWENLEDQNFFKTPLIRLNFVNPDIIFSSSFE
ncbi:MAG: choice-of-anchor Q domain-containing protein [Marinicellaceae bacterium]